MSQYIYEALPSGANFRVLVLEPETNDAPLHCTLLTAPLYDAPYFDCISYVWGTSERSAELFCNGQRLLITPSLEDILRRVRWAEKSRLIWADAICINQEDLAEKSHQVALMGEIYRMSHRTLIFVSNNDQGHAETTHALLSEIDDGILGSVLPGWDTLPLLEVDHPLLSDPRWASLGHLLKATWFTRGWCVQEAAFAKDGRLIWGQQELSWSQFMRVYTWMLRRAHQVIVKYELGMSTLHISAYSLAHKEDVRALMPERFWNDIGNTLETFHEARSLGLTDPRDRIYAFTGLLTRDSLTNLKVIPDYRKSFPDVCTDLALGFLDVHQNLDLLMYVQHTLSTLKTNFPSWVPLWNFSDTPHQDIESIHAGQPPIVDLEAPLAPKNGRLQVQAIRFSKIKYVSEVFTQELVTVDTIAKIWSQVCDARPTQCSRDADHLLMFVTSLVSGIVGLDQGRHLQNLAAFMLEMLRRSGQKIEEGYEQRWAGQAEGGSVDDFLMFISLYSPNRKIVVSERGYGMAALSTQVGDDCAILYGAKSLFVLRGAGDAEYRLVGTLFHSSERQWEQHETDWTLGVGLQDGRDWIKWGAKSETLTLV